MIPATAVITPPSWGSPAIELGNRVWAKRLLPVGEIEYKGRTLKFTRDYLDGLVRAFQDQAYDQVAFQLADSANTHTNDPERFRGEIVDMQARDDGLWLYLNPTEAGDRVLRDNPNLGVSARIVEQYQRADGKFYPAAIQHVLGTLDPRVTGLGPWQAVEMSNDAAMVIDLSTSVWLGEPGPPAYASSLDELLDGLTEAEALDLMEAVYDSGEELSDAELDALISEAGADDETAAALADFDAQFSANWAVRADLNAARADADLEDLITPPRGAEAILARSVQRLAAGTHPVQEFSNPAAAAIELSAREARGICGPPDPANGTCSARYHSLACISGGTSADDSIGLANSGAYGQALAGFARAVELAGAPSAAIDTGDPDGPAVQIPQHTLELAHALAAGWGLHTGTALPAAPAYEDLLVGDPATGALGGYPGISELAQGLGLK
jgi:hypothetical protein